MRRPKNKPHVHHQRLGEPDAQCDFGSFDAPYVNTALDGLQHYHAKHTRDAITIWRDWADKDKSAPGALPACIVLVSADPDWIARLTELLAQSEQAFERDKVQGS